MNFKKADKPVENQTVIIETETKKGDVGVVVTTNIYCGGWKNRAKAYEAYKAEGIRKKKSENTTYVYGLMKLNKLKDNGDYNYFIPAEQATGDALNASE